MLRRVLLAAVLSGLAAGLLMAAIQHWRVTPLIIAAEAYETASAAQTDQPDADVTASGQDQTRVHDHADGDDHDANSWKPAAGWQRTASTAAADIAAGIGFAALLAGTSILLNTPITPANGLIWGLVGFLTFSLAPSVGMPPELPGMPEADLLGRQIWWWLTAAATGAGLGMLLLIRTRLWAVLGLGLMLLPHIIGAPAPVTHESAVPASLATAFAANALASAAIFWLALGASLGRLMTRTNPNEPQ